MNEKKKIPIIKYLSYLLIVSVLFTGVTFSRYSSATSGDFSAGVSPFIASYEIDDISAASYTNSDFFLLSGAATGTPRTVRMTIRNYEKDEGDAVLRYSDIDLKATIRLYMPAELADNFVIQMAEAVGDEVISLTPQYVVGDFVYAVSEGTEDIDGDGINEYVRQKDGTGNFVYADYSDGGVRETIKSQDYQKRECTDETLSMTGGFAADGTGYIAASAENGNALSLTSSYKISNYSVGFHRGIDENDYRSQLYLDLEKEVLFYTIDISIPQMELRGMQAEEKTFVLYLSLAKRIDGTDYNFEWSSDTPEADTTRDMNRFLIAPQTGEEYLFNGAKVLGYHFDVSADTYASVSAPETMGTTTVRVKKVYDYRGGAKTFYYHVAPISESTYSYVHPIENFFDSSGAETQQPDTLEKIQSLFGVCNNLLGQPGAYFIAFRGLNDHPLFENYESQIESGEQEYALFNSLSKSYSTQFNVLFIQTSESIQGGIGQ